MKTLLSLVLVAAVFGLGWHLRGQWDSVRAQYGVRMTATVAVSSASAVPPSASAVRRAPKPAPASQALPGPANGNTDGGLIPWNGGDLHMADYSPRR